MLFTLSFACVSFLCSLTVFSFCRCRRFCARGEMLLATKCHSKLNEGDINHESNHKKAIKNSNSLFSMPFLRMSLSCERKRLVWISAMNDERRRRWKTFTMLLHTLCVTGFLKYFYGTFKSLTEVV